MSEVSFSVFTDGGARGNPGPAAAAVVVKDNQGKIVYQEGFFLGRRTNNEAEYEGVIRACDWLEKNLSSCTTISFYFDSQLLANQLSGQWKIKAPHLKPIVIGLQSRIKAFLKPVKFYFVPRRENHLADTLVNQTLDRQGLG